MKSIALIALGLLFGVAIMLFVPHGAPQLVYAGPPSGNGDVNGSGKIDIADAVCLLAYLFAQGPEPEVVACDTCCPPPSGYALPATGQTQCYVYDGEQGSWVEVPCEDAVDRGQDGFYRAGCPTAGRFVDNGDGTVTDTCTGLMWQRSTADINGDGTIIERQDALRWQSALQYCENLAFAGHADWRLPNVRELQSIVDYGRFDPSIDPMFGVEFGRYWSSSTHAFGTVSAWFVSCGGIVYVDDKNVSYYVRAIRDAR